VQRFLLLAGRLPDIFSLLNKIVFSSVFASDLAVRLVTMWTRRSLRALEKLAGWCTSRVLLLRLLPMLMLFALGPRCPGPTPTPPPKPGAWLVFLCQASDAPQEPHTIGFYQELFDRNQPDLLVDYFQKISNGTIDLSGTEVYGWFKMAVNTATIDKAVRNNTTQPNRSQTAQDCKSAGAASFLASNRTIDPDRYAGFIAVINVQVDAGATGRSLVANEYESASFYSHEMLHVYGLDHSFTMANDLSQDHSWEQGVDRPYFDCWDIMSFATCTYRFNTANHSLQGPELQTAYREKLGWLPPRRIFVKDATDVSPSTVTMTPVSEPNHPGPMMARIEFPNGSRYVVEYRVPTGFDRAVPRRAMVIRELRQDGKSYLVTRQNGNIGLAQGEQFTDAANFLSITVDALTAQSATVTINPRFSSPANLGEVCGNKYVGEVRPCQQGAVCSAHYSRPLVTDNYFCQ
jgi:hypothetical protein